MDKFSDSTGGKIFIGVAIFAFTGLLSYFGGRITAPNSAPVASLVPEKVEAEAGETIQFSAAESISPDGSIENYRWSIGGYPHEQSSVGYCDISEDQQNATCIFSAPGNFSVSVEIVADDDKSDIAVSPVSIAMTNGFVGLLLKSGSEKKERDDAFRALLKLADWPEIQRGVSRPILLYDPDLGEPVFAASINSSKYNSNGIGDSKALAGVKLIVPRFSVEIRSLLAALVESHGGTLVVIPASEIYTALSTGLSNSGFLPVSSVGEYRSILAGDK